MVDFFLDEAAGKDSGNPEFEACLQELWTWLMFSHWEYWEAIDLLAGFHPLIQGDNEKDSEAPGKRARTGVLSLLFSRQRAHPIEPVWPVSRWISWALHIGKTPPWYYTAKARWPKLLPKVGEYREWLRSQPVEQINKSAEQDRHHKQQQLHLLTEKMIQLERERVTIEDERLQLDQIRRQLEADRTAFAEERARALSQQARNDSDHKPRAESPLLNIIGALLECVQGHWPEIGPHPGFTNEERLKQFLAHKYDGIYGLSESNLDRRFPQARHALQHSCRKMS